MKTTVRTKLPPATLPRVLLLWLDDVGAGCGLRLVIQVKEGRRYAELLDYGTLQRVRVERGVAAKADALPLDKYARRLARGITRRRRQFAGYGFRFPERLCKETAYALLRAAQVRP